MKYALKWACFLVTFQFHCYSCQDVGKRQESNNSIETSEILGNSTSCPFESTNQEGILEICKFWIQGVLITLIGLFGITGNLVSVFVLTRTSMLSTFNLILASLTTMDTFFLVLSIIEYSMVQAFNMKSQAYDRFFVYFLYPMNHITLISSVFLHIVLAFERYLAVCHPHVGLGRTAKGPQKMSAQTSKAIRKKALFYIVPVILSSFIINFPKWFELELKDMVFNEEENELREFDHSNNTLDQEGEIITVVDGTWLRYNEDYVHYYMHWTLFLTTGIFPLGALLFFNISIYLRLKSVQQIRTNSSNRNEPNYAATLSSIIIIFIICHLPRLIKTVYEIVFTKMVKNSGGSCDGFVNPSKCLVYFNNFILVINASSGFFVYCFIGSFGKKFIEVLSQNCRRGKSASNTDEEAIELHVNPREPESGKSSGKLPIVGTSGTRENQVNGTSVAEHTTILHQVDSKNVGETKAVVILEPNPKEV